MAKLGQMVSSHFFSLDMALYPAAHAHEDVGLVNVGGWYHVDGQLIAVQTSQTGVSQLTDHLALFNRGGQLTVLVGGLAVDG